MYSNLCLLMVRREFNGTFENLSIYSMYVSCTLGPAYNEQFDTQKCAGSSRVLIITKPFDIVVNEMVQAR